MIADRPKAYLGNDKYVFISYSHNFLDRCYNCICVNILTDKDMFDLFSKTYAFIPKASIYSIQNVKLDVEFEIVMKNRKNTNNNPDVKEIP